MAWIRQHPAIWALLGALVVGQVLQPILKPYVNQSPTGAIVVLVAMLLLAAVIVWVRVSLGNQLASAARARQLNLPRPASLPARYAVSDAPGMVVTAVFGVVDVALLLLVQATLRRPTLAVAGTYVREAWAETAFVAVVVLLALLVLVKLYRAGAPVLVQLAWWGLDRVVPTAGFLGAHAPVVETKVQPALAPAPRGPGSASAPAAAAAATDLEPTVRSVPGPAAELAPTMLSSESDATVVASERVPGADEPTVISFRRPPPPTADAEDHK